MSKHLFDAFPGLEERIKSAEKIILFLDYDGTLAEFRSDAMKAFPSEDMRNTLEKVVKNPKIDPFIITGRNRYRMEKLLWIKGINYICAHGFEMDYSDFKIDISDEEKKTIRKIFNILEKEFGDMIADMNMKGDYGINFNYRPYEGDHSEIERKFVEIVKGYDTDDKFRIMHLSKGFNVLPKIWDKGKAVDFILEKHTSPDALPIYFGDDVTDEDAFKVLRDRGITIYVKNDDKRETYAEYFVKNPDEVLKSLRMLFI